MRKKNHSDVFKVSKKAQPSFPPFLSFQYFNIFTVGWISLFCWASCQPEESTSTWLLERAKTSWGSSCFIQPGKLRALLSNLWMQCRKCWALLYQSMQQAHSSYSPLSIGLVTTLGQFLASIILPRRLFIIKDSLWFKMSCAPIISTSYIWMTRWSLGAITSTIKPYL